MVNQGGYDWKFDESDDKTKIMFSLDVPKFMDTSSLNVDVQPEYIRVVVKDKLTQIHWPEEMLCDSATVQRSQTTGSLCITATKSTVDVIRQKNKYKEDMMEERRKKRQLEELSEQA